LVVEITSGTGAGQFRVITDYAGSTGTITVAQWDAIPVATDSYVIHTRSGLVQANSQANRSKSVILRSGECAIDDVFNQAFIRLVLGRGKGQTRRITDYVGSSRLATVDVAWGELPDSTTAYIICGEGGTAGTTGATASNLICGDHSEALAVNQLVQVYSGTNVGETRTISAVPAREVSTVTVASTAVNSEYFVVADQDGTVGFWIDLDNSGSTATTSATREVEITTLVTGDTTAQMATKIATAVNADAQFSATVSGSVVTLTSRLSGTRTTIATSDAGVFTVASTTTGTNTLSVGTDWSAACDATSQYVIFGGYAGTYETVADYTQVTVVAAIGTSSGERGVVDLQLGMTSTGSTRRGKYAETSVVFPSSVHTLTIVTQYFRCCLVGMGTALTGNLQVILHTTKNKALTSFVGEAINDSNDCELTRAVISGKTTGGSYRNARMSWDGHIHADILTPTSAFGELMSIHPKVISQMSFGYGLHPQKVSTLVDFGFTVTTATQGASSIKHKATFTFTTQPDDGAYFYLFAQDGTQYYVYFGSDPAATGTGIAVTRNATATTQAENFRSAIDGNVNFDAPNSIAGIFENIVFVEWATAGTPTVNPPVRIDDGGSMPVTTTESTATTSQGLLSLTNADAVGSYAVVRSKKLLVYRPGIGAEVRFTALFTTPTAGVLQYAGLANLTNAFYFGFDGSSSTFGIIHRYGGRPEIRTLTITGTGSGNGDVAINLDGVAHVVAVTDRSSVNTIASQIATSTTLVNSKWRAFQNNDTVVYFSTTVTTAVGARSGNYGFTDVGSTGITASMAQTAVGVPNTQTFIPQYEWNRDRMDGTGGTGMVLRPERGNVFRISFQWLGFGAITFFIEESSTGNWTPVHVIEFANANTVVSLNQPSMHMEWVASSTTSTTGNTLKAASAAMFIQGNIFTDVPRHSATSNAITPGSDNTEYVLMALRIPIVYKGVINLTEVLLEKATLINTGTKSGLVRIYLNPTITDVSDYSFANTDSAVQSWTPTSSSLTGFSGGTLLEVLPVAKDTSNSIDLHDDIIYIQNGDIILFTVSRGATSVVATMNVSWIEVH